MATGDKDIREQIDEWVGMGQWAKASAMLAELWRQQPVMANATYIVSRYERMGSQLPLTPYRLALTIGSSASIFASIRSQL